MTQTAIIAFVVTFVAGPAICAALLRLPASLWSLGLLAIGVTVSGLGALRVQVMGGSAPLSLLLLWLAWVLGVAMVALALRARIRHNYRARRWLTVVALLATTLPWFGLATARLMV